MNWIRSFTFALFLVVWTICVGLVGIFLQLLSHIHPSINVGKVWSGGVHFYLTYICGVKVVVEGANTLPPAPFIVACQHQSAWETVFLTYYFENPIYILKREIFYIPIFGWYIFILGMIGVRRGHISAVKHLKKSVRKVLEDDGRVLIIFPEGTRVAPGVSVEYKAGVHIVHQACPHIPIVPVALNSASCWPARSFLVRSGTIHLRFLPPLTGNFGKEELLTTLQKNIEEAANKL